MAPPAGFIGRSLAQIDLRRRFGLQVVAIRDVLSGNVQLVPQADATIKDSDVLVVVGREQDIQKVK